MAQKGKVTLYTPSGETIVWDVEAEPLMSGGCCTFMQNVNGVPTRMRVMGTVVAEAYDSKVQPRQADGGSPDASD